MSTLAIDTHKTIQKLKEKGYSDEQAEGFVDALTESELVSKSDLKVAVAEIKTWVAGMLIGQIALMTGIIALMFNFFLK